VLAGTYEGQRLDNMLHSEDKANAFDLNRGRRRSGLTCWATSNGKCYRIVIRA